MKLSRCVAGLSLAILFGLSACASADQTEKPAVLDWQLIAAEGEPVGRHEAAAFAYQGKIYLIGGRRINPVDVFDVQTKTWSQNGPTPIEIHHFQTVMIGDAVYIIGAMTGQWPNETPLANILIYYPETDTYETGAEIPEARRRGGAGAAVHDGKIYIIGGIVNGHMDGYVDWFDVYDPVTHTWRVLPDAPHRRDHFQATIADSKLFAFAGRRSEWRAGLGFEQTVIPGDVFDFETGVWQEGTKALNIPTPRAGNMAASFAGRVIIAGGESGGQEASHNEVEVYDPATSQWLRLPDMKEGRHGAGLVILDGELYAISGSGNRGGGPELTTIERLHLNWASADN